MSLTRALALAALFAAPAAPPAAAQEAAADAPPLAGGESVVEARYACDGGAQMQVVYVTPAQGTGVAVVLHEGEMIPMGQTVMASGASYRSLGPGAPLELHTKGPRATLQSAEGPLRDGCVAG